MTKKELFLKLLDKVQSRGLLTTFIKELFDYEDLNDFNYIYRLTKEDNLVIMDIYDNVSINRFNRYIFSFDSGDYDIKVVEEDNVYVTRIYVANITKPSTKLLKLAYMLNLDKEAMISYAENFLNNDIVKILREIINKPIYK